MNTFLTLSGIIFVFLGLTYLYRPAWILVLNKFMRERVFADARVILERRQKGLFFLLCSLLMFYWSYSRAHYGSTRVMDHFVSVDRMLYQATNHYRKGEYAKAEVSCQRILARQPNNSDVLYMLAASRFLQGNKSGAEEVWTKAESLNSLTPAALQFRDVCIRHILPTTS